MDCGMIVSKEMDGVAGVARNATQTSYDADKTKGDEPCLKTRFLSNSAPPRTCRTRRRTAKNWPLLRVASWPGLVEKRRKI